MTDLNQDSPLHLADALADELANTPAQALLGEVTEDLGDRRALAREFDAVVARALRQSRRRQLATAAKNAGAWLSQSLFRKPVWIRVGTLAALVIAVAGYHYRGEQRAVPPIASLNLQAPPPQQPREAPSLSAFSDDDAAGRQASAAADMPRGELNSDLERAQNAHETVPAAALAASPPPAVQAAAAAAPIKSPPLLAWPVSGRITENFGARTSALADPRAQAPAAEGITIAVPAGAEIRAAADGIVSSVGADKGPGKFLAIRHDDDLKTGYGRLRRVMVKVSDQVYRGEVIAKGVVASRGAQPQLYFELHQGTAPIDPMPYLPPIDSGKTRETTERAHLSR